MKNNFYQIVSENKTYSLFTKKLKILIQEKNKKTLKNKDVDFFFDFKGFPIYIEVKANLNEKNFKSGMIGEKNKIFLGRFLRRSNNKFLENNCNIVVINDSNTSRTPIFDSLELPLIKKREIQKELGGYPKISALIILSPNYEEKELEYQMFYNPECQKQLPEKLKSILDLHKSNKN